MNRRGFLGAILAAGVAPYVVRTAGVLMPVRPIVTASTWFAGGGTLGEFPYADPLMDEIVRLLNTTNEIMADMRFVDLPAGHTTVVRAPLPLAFWRQVER